MVYASLSVQRSKKRSLACQRIVAALGRVKQPIRSRGDAPLPPRRPTFWQSSMTLVNPRIALLNTWLLSHEGTALKSWAMISRNEPTSVAANNGELAVMVTLPVVALAVIVIEASGLPGSIGPCVRTRSARVKVTALVRMSFLGGLLAPA